MQIPPTTAIQQANADFWNETASWYAERGEAEALEFLLAGGNYLLDCERELLGDLAPWCTRAIHLQCSHGNDALSLLRQGALEVIGVDISERLLASAQRKTTAMGANAHWILSDITSAPHNLDETADLVYTGKGALCWMMDLSAWAAVAARLLRPGGSFFLHESHPLDWVWDKEADNYVLDQVHGDYFSQTPRSQLFSQAVHHSPHYRQWTLGAIVNAMIGAGLSITSLVEHPEPFWDQFPHVPDATLHRLPHAFTLTARKT